VKRPLLLVLRALGLGDLLTAVPALRALAEAFPEHRRVLVAPRALAPLLALIRDGHGRPVAEEILDSPALAPIAREVSGPQIAVNLHGRGPQSHRLMLALGPERLLSFAHPGVPESSSSPSWRAEEHEVGRWCRLLRENGLACDPDALDIDRPGMRETSMAARARGATLLHPGAASIARHWPMERWVAVAAAERALGREVLVSGGRAEIALARRVAGAAGLPSEAVLAGRTDLRELAAAVGAAARVVCADTGVAHLATALGTPSVVLFGPVPPYLWGPPPSRAQHRALWKGRRGDPNADSPDPGLVGISVSDVLGALDGLPARRPPVTPRMPVVAGAPAAADPAPGRG
jgi:ADP-heptose:LPS heptosyltransferase